MMILDCFSSQCAYQWHSFSVKICEKDVQGVTHPRRLFRQIKIQVKPKDNLN